MRHLGIVFFIFFLLTGMGTVMAQEKPKTSLEKGAADKVAGGLPLTAGMRKDPEAFFPVFKRDDTLRILKDGGFRVFDDFDHHRREIGERIGLHVKYAKLGINIPRRCFWVTYNFWKKRALLRKFLPPSLIRSLIDLTVEGKNDEMGGILCLRDMKTGRFFLGFGMFTRRKEFTTDNSVPARNVFRDYVALRETTPEVVEILKEALTWIVSHKKQLTQTYWEPVGKKLVEKRNAKF